MHKIEELLGEWVATRPAFLALTGLVIGILLGHRSSEASNPQILTTLLSAMIVAVGAFAFRRLFLIWLCVLFSFALIGLATTFDSSRIDGSRFVSAKKQAVQATVARVLGSNYGHRTILLKSGHLAKTHKSLPGYGRLNLRENSTPILSGDRISFRSSIRTPVNRGNPGEYNWEADCESEGIAWLVNARGPDALVILKAAWAFSPSALLSRLRMAMSAFIENKSGMLFKDSDANAIKAIHKGIILGDRAEISSELNKAFSNSGLVHMLSASGSHVTIVAAMTFFMVKILLRMAPNIMLWIPLPQISAFFCIPVISVYCLLVGLKPPAMRAGVVGITLAVAVLTERRWDSLNSLAISAILILLFFPLSIFTPSFQLSFTAVAGILLIVQSPLFHLGSSSGKDLEIKTYQNSTRHYTKTFLSLDMIRRPAFSLVFSSLAATVAITPIVIHIFHSVPIYSIPASLVSDFALTLGLSIGLVSAFVGAISPLIGGYLICPADLFVWLVIKIALITDSLPCSTLKIPNLGDLGLILASSTTLITFYHIVRPGRLSALFVASSWMVFVVLLTIGQIIQDRSDNLKIVFLNVGNGDSAFIKAPGTSGILVDAGPKTPYFDSGQSIITPFLLWQVVRRLDAIIISHPESDHMGGALTTMKNFNTKTLFLNPSGDSRQAVKELSSFVSCNAVQMMPAITSPEKISIGEIDIAFLHPGPILVGKKLNDMSVVARVDYRKFSVLFTGDLERDGEEELLKSNAKIRATILKVPHHGGKTSATSKRLLSVVRPRIAIVSAEYPPRGGLPNPDVLSRLKDVGSEIFWTGRDGAITIETDGIKSLKVTSGKRNREMSLPWAIDNSEN